MITPTKTVSVLINGWRFELLHASLSYSAIAAVAGFSGTPSMTFREKGREGLILHPGEYVIPTEDMVFNIYDTSNA